MALPRQAENSRGAYALWTYRSLVAPILNRVLALFLCCVSVFVVWSEVTIPIGGKVDLSPFSKLVRLHQGEELMLQLLVFLPLVRKGIDSQLTVLYSVVKMYFCSLL